MANERMANRPQSEERREVESTTLDGWRRGLHVASIDPSRGCKYPLHIKLWTAID